VATVLSGDDSLDALPLRPTAVAGLHVLTAGPAPAAPADLLDGPRAGPLVERLAAAADLVLFDAPPLLAVTDAAVLAPRLDGVLLVLAAGKSRRDQTARARELLDTVGATTIGVVLTGVEPDPAYGYGAGAETDSERA
jgi:non-specific protein-tyrosine kinase